MQKKMDGQKLKKFFEKNKKEEAKKSKCFVSRTHKARARCLKSKREPYF